MRTFLLLSALLLAVPAAAQTTGERLLSGTTLGLPWGFYQGGLTNLGDGEARLRMSAPQGARVLGTRYDAGGRAALLTYRGDRDARAALAFAVEQLQRQGFNLTYRAYPSPGQARALLRRVDRLLEVQIIRGAEGVTQALYRFRDGEQPERLLTDQVPDDLRVYAAPIDLKTVQAEPGRVYLTLPDEQLIDFTAYRDGAVILAFYGGYTLQQLLDFYLPLFIQQGFVEIGDVATDEAERTLRFGRGSERLTLRLEASPSVEQTRVTLWYRR
ncbi:hypothetical protein F8S09_15135 [Deinococcus sp. SDU3-2]|uniref:Uncharacterized protein n=1 Tax=Deinococcus terrestris TaxID=2651870 RepID=A0A7X1TT27_9DEIO|nr:hypothetical protein [Deinococcus terrestris]MPY67992.1 hypothetical protein [Deinococcus terrestris]